MSKCENKNCPKEKICNPLTGRCVLKSGSIGKKLIKNKKRSKSRSRSYKKSYNKSYKRSYKNKESRNRIKPKKMSSIEHQYISEKYGNILHDFVGNDYDIIKLLGKGSYGRVYLTCANDIFDCRVIKIQYLDSIDKDDLFHEIAMQKKFAEIDLAPQIYNYKIVKSKNNKEGKKEFGLIEMEKVDGVLDDILKVRQPKKILDSIVIWIADLIDTLCENNLVHGDMHFGNIGYSIILKNNKTDVSLDNISDNFLFKLMLIDFGWSCCKHKEIRCNPELELLQVIRTINIGKMDQFNREYLFDKFYTLYNTSFTPLYKRKMPIKNIIDKVDREWNKTFDNYEELFKDDL